MGLFGFGRKKRVDNLVRSREFLEKYKNEVNGLLIFTEKSEKVTEELKALQKDFLYTTPSSNSDAKAIEKKIVTEFKKLTDSLQQPTWDEDAVLLNIKIIRKYIVDIASTSRRK